MGKKVITEKMKDMLRRSGSQNLEIARAGMQELAIALTLPLKQGVIKGSNLEGIFSPVEFEPGASIEFPLDFLAPGNEKDHVAYVIPSQGKIPERHIEGDFVMVPTYDVADSIDWRLKYARDARWDIVERAMEVLEGGFVRKRNDDGHHTLLASGVGRNIVVYDDAAPNGLFTKRLIALSKTVMRRKAGGNATSVNKGKLTDVFMSPESLEDMRSWDLTQIDDFTRNKIFMAGEGEASLTRIFDVMVHDVDEYGETQDYQNYYTNVLGGTMPTGKLEIAVGLDLSKDDSFINPIRQQISLYEDPFFHRQLRAGMYGFTEYGFTVLDSRRVIILAL